jgi:hypothetical protein
VNLSGKLHGQALLNCSTSPFRDTLDIQCLSSQTARSPGDAMRELDSMGVS